MSLINKMLRDLESRHNPTDPRPPKLIYEDLHSPGPVRRAAGRVPILVAGAAVLVVGAGFAWYLWGPGSGKNAPAGPSGPIAAKRAKPSATTVAANGSGATSQQVASGGEPQPKTAGSVSEPGPTASSLARSETDIAGGAPIIEKRLREPTPVEDAEGRYRDAVTLIRQGRSPEAVTRLRGALELDPGHAQAAELLAGLLLQQGGNDEARKVLEDALARSPSHYSLAQLLARQLVQEGQEAKALTVLERSRAAAARDADYLGFLAVLYQRAADHKNSVAAFQQALALSPAEGRWWIGLGVSLDAERQTDAATGAFERALALGNLDPKLRQYAEQRLKR